MELIQLSPYKWQLPQKGGMRVPGFVYAERSMLEGKEKNEPLQQVANVASQAMPAAQLMLKPRCSA